MRHFSLSRQAWNRFSILMHNLWFKFALSWCGQKNSACLFEPSNNNKKKIPSHWPKLGFPQIETRECWWLQSTTYTCFYLVPAQRHKIYLLRQTTSCFPHAFLGDYKNEFSCVFPPCYITGFNNHFFKPLHETVS